MQLPKYIQDIDGAEGRAARCRFLLRLAALHYSPEGKLKQLSEALDLHPSSLATLADISPKLAVKLESVLGADLFPRRLFRPDIFDAPTSV